MFFDKMRNYTKTWLFKLLLGLICLSFVIFGLTDLVVRFVNDKPLAKVGNIAISENEFNYQIRKKTEEISRLSKEPIDGAALKQMGLHKKILNQLINQRAAAQLFKLLDMKTSPNMVRDTIQNFPAFMENGQYSEERLRRYLSHNHMSDYSFTREVKDMLYTMQLTTPIAKSMTLPKIYTDICIAELTNKSTYKAVAVDLKTFPIAAPSEEDLKKFYEAHKTQYKSPELRRFDYVIFDEEKDSEKIKVTEDEIKSRFEQIKSTFETPEVRHVERVVTTGEAVAKDVIELIKKGTPLKDAATQNPAATYEDLGEVSKNSHMHLVDDVVFTLKEGEISKITPTDKTFSIYVVRKIEPAVTKSLKEVHSEVKKIIQKEKYTENAQAMRNEFEDALAAGKPLAEVANAHGLEVHNVAPIDRAGAPSDIEGKAQQNGVKELAALPDDIRSQIISTAFEQSTVAETVIVDVKTGVSIAVRLSEVIPATIPAFHDVKNKVKTTHHIETAYKKVMAEFSNLLKTLKTSEDFEKAVTANKWGKVQSLNFSYVDMQDEKFEKTPTGQFLKDVNPQFIGKLFKAPVGTAISDNLPNGKVIFTFHESEAPQPITPKLRQTILNNLHTQAERDIMSYFTYIAKKRIDIMINHEIMEQLSKAMNTGD